MLRICLFVILCFSAHREVNTRIELFANQDPSFLLVNKMYPTMPLTIFDTDKEQEIFLPVGLSEISESALSFQLFHSYYEGLHKNFYFEWNGDKRTRVLPEGDYLQARRGRKNILTGMTAHPIHNSLFIKIMYNGKCLEALKTKSRYRDAHPLRFVDCADSNYQRFKFVSHAKAVCVLGLEECTHRNEDIFRAEEVLRSRVHHFIINK